MSEVSASVAWWTIALLVIVGVAVWNIVDRICEMRENQERIRLKDLARRLEQDEEVDDDE